MIRTDMASGSSALVCDACGVTKVAVKADVVCGKGGLGISYAVPADWTTTLLSQGDGTCLARNACPECAKQLAAVGVGS